ncbi:MAG: hypothetical protein QG608_2559 [Actinomycetota bacterium]|nr:hypothetical protein [Actinomycetota bacterium]MDQ1294674.1 hypothetical protein [Actinomycetota bacterium]
MNTNEASRDVRAHYDRVALREGTRLQDPYRASEALVLRAVVGGLLADRGPLSVVAEIGSGPGHYGPWLHSIAERVLCLDLSAVELAAVPGVRDTARIQADACRLPVADGRLDAVFLLGPHYHLPEAVDRRRMINEAVRVLVPGGLLVVAGLNRTGASVKTVWRCPRRAWRTRVLLGKALRASVALPAGALGDFPPAFLSDGHALRAELETAGLVDVSVHGCESFTVLAPGLARRARRGPRAGRALDALLVSSAPGRVSLALSEHLLAVARKPGPPG